MRFYNSNVGKAKLRRDNFRSGDNRNNFKQKSSLSKRIIEERAKGITADNIDKEVERLALEVQIGEMWEQIIYHVRFYMSVRPITHDKNKIEEWALQMRDLKNQYKYQEIDAKAYLNALLDIDNEIMDIITAWEQCQ